MKQHITVKQLNELSDNGKEKLRKWWKPKKGDWACHRFVHITENHFGDRTYRPDVNKWETLVFRETPTKNRDFVFDKEYEALPVLSIGQMIEFLGEDDMEILYIEPHDKYSLKCVFDGQNWEKEYFGRNFSLCDLLWEAVKEVLEK